MPLLHQRLSQEELERQQPVNLLRYAIDIIVHFAHHNFRPDINYLLKMPNHSNPPTTPFNFQSGLWDFLQTTVTEYDVSAGIDTFTI